MRVVHFATELSGGAGGFVRNIHIAMQDAGFSSLLISREKNDLTNSATIKPLRRVTGSLRARLLWLLNKIGVINSNYAMFGIERAPVSLDDIQRAIGSRKPDVFMFYWISYFLDFKTILELRHSYPEIPFVFICTDEAFLTGGCHYSYGCLGYQESCKNCPATCSAFLKKRIENGFCQRQAWVSAINPLVIYPTTNLERTGKKSAVLKNVLSSIIPLGAVSNSELKFEGHNHGKFSVRDNKKEKIKLLVRSSSEYRKGCDLFISAIKRLSEQTQDLKNILEVISIGDETLSIAHIDQYVNHVDKGYVNREELISIYRDIDLFMVTSREDSGPLMINECVGLGIFVISTPVGVANDLILEGQNGIIIPDISCNAMSDALIEVLDNFKMVHSSMGRVSESQKLSSMLTFDGYIKSMMKLLNF